MSDERFRTIEERMGTLYGILKPLPKQIDQLFSKINEIKVEQAELHTDKQGRLTRLEEDLKELEEKTEKKDTKEIDLRVHDLEAYVTQQKSEHSFWRQHLVAFLLGLLGMLLGFMMSGKS